MRCARGPVILWAEMNPANGVTMMGHERRNGSEACRSIDESQAVQPSGGERRGMVSAGRRRVTASALAAMVAVVAVPATVSAHIYWTHFTVGATGSIGRANLDGSNANRNFITGLKTPRGIAVEGTHIYWTDFGRSSIGRANLDGSDVDQDFIKAVGHGGPPAHPTALAVDRGHIYFSDTAFAVLVIARINGEGNWLIHKIRDVGTVTGIAVNHAHIYWTWSCPNPNVDCARPRGIGRMKLDGTALDRNFIDVPARGVAVDTRHIYWAENLERGRIGRANLDGSARDANFIADVRSPLGVAVGPLPHPLRRP